MNHLSILLRITLFWLISTVALAHVQVASLKLTSAQLDHQLSTLAQIESKLEANPKIPISPYQDRFEILKILNSAKKNLKKLHADSAEHQHLFDALGPAPSKDNPEGPLITQQRDTYQHNLINYRTETRKAQAIIATAQTLLQVINHQQTARKITRLKQTITPLYLADSWQIIQEETSAFINTATSCLLAMELRLAHQLQHPTSWLGLGMLLFLLYALLGPVRQHTHNYWPQQTSNEKPSVHDRASAVIGALMNQALIPFTALFLTVLVIHLSSLVTSTVALSLYATCLAFGCNWLLCSLVRSNLAVKYPKWRSWPYSDAIASMLQPRLINWVRLAMLTGWIAALLNLSLAPKHVLSLMQTLTFVLLALSTISLMPNGYWKAKRTGLQPLTHHKIIRLITFFMLMIMPVASASGYRYLANTLFRNLISTLLLVGAVYAVSQVVKRGIHKLTKRWQPIVNEEDPEAAQKMERRRGYALYWYNLAATSALVLMGAILLAIIWGVNVDTLLDWARLILFGDPASKHSDLTLINFVIGASIFLLIYAATKSLQQILMNRVFPNTDLDSGARHALLTALGYVGGGIALIAGLNAVGLNLSSLLWVAGGLSVGIGLGLQPIITNFVSGLIMLVERPVKVGDILTINGHKGVVTHIKVRATVLRTFQRGELLIPNSQLITGTVMNWSHHDELQRMEVTVGVAYGSDTELVKQCLLDSCKAVPKILKDPAPYVQFTDFADSALTFQLRAYAKGTTTPASDLRFEIEKRFKEAGIEMPFPQRDIHIIDNAKLPTDKS